MSNKKQAIYAIHVPQFYNDGRLVESDYLDGVVTQLSDLFGGFTHCEVIGGWVFREGKDTYAPGQIITEQMTRVFAIGDLTAKNKRAVRELAKSICADLAQEAVYLEITPTSVEFVGLS